MRRPLLLSYAFVAIAMFSYLIWKGALKPEKIQIAEVGSTAVLPDPQYIFVRKSNTNCNPTNCSFLWHLNSPNSDYAGAISDVINKIGSRGSDQRKLGIGVLVYYNQYDFNNVKISLQKILAAAQAQDIPLYIAMDGFQWWEARPDLWNWWDPNLPGYNPANTQNVEWTCASPTCATKKAWRNWGSEFVMKPHPNIASRAFIDTNKARLNELLPIIVNWYSSLPDSKKWLLGGVGMGVEDDIGHNYYYYANAVGGTRLPLGYAASTTLSLPGGATEANKIEAVKRYFAELNQHAISHGIPEQKIFNHVHPNQALAAIASFGKPGWSHYGDQANNPASMPGLDTSLNQTGKPWGSPEWLTYATDKNGWVQAMRTSLNYRNNRMINISNWEEVRDKPYVLEAIRQVLSEQPPATPQQMYYFHKTQNACVVTSSTYLPTQITECQNNLTTYVSGQTNGVCYTTLSACQSAQGILPVSSPTAQAQVMYYFHTPSKSCLSTTNQYQSSQIPACQTNLQTYLPGQTGGICYTSLDSCRSANPQPNIPGDITGDGHVNLFDYNELLAKFGNPYTIFDYNTLIANYGK